ncbi:MAG: polyprenyl diphosphate synthase, partial [Desulfobacterales bacterium]|nr:polyprenyl diphosphate synthase [Desulfobacterales bacterium]
MNSSVSPPVPDGLDVSKLPGHVAIIMDGNGRWAEKRLMNRIKGHQAGAEAVRRIVRTCREIGIPILTLYAFSTENWQRPEIEIATLMSLLKKFLDSERNEMIENNIRLNAIGQLEKLPEDVRISLKRTMDLTGKNKGMLLNLALSYGGRAEIVDMVKAIAGKAIDGEMDPYSITPEIVAENLYTGGMPDPDLLIRTSGEM